MIQGGLKNTADIQSAVLGRDFFRVFTLDAATLNPKTFWETFDF
jgi:hypothetical protein